MNNRSYKGWLYLLPAILFLGAFMVYPLVDVFVYSFEEGYTCVRLLKASGATSSVASECECASMNPGETTHPCASKTSASFAPETTPFGTTSAIRSPSRRMEPG